MSRLMLAIIAWTLGAMPAGAAAIRVSAASSLSEALTELGAVFERSHPGSKVELNFAGSQVLRLQIEEGAEVDVFASADRAQMEPLERQGLMQAPRVLAHNRLVVVASARTNRVRQLVDLGAPGVQLVLPEASVPAGAYARQVLARLAVAPQFGAAFRDAVQANIVSEETNVRLVVAKVVLGEADAGFAYASDVSTPRPGLSVIEIPPDLNVVAESLVAVARGSQHERLARSFVDLVLSPAGQRVFAQHGFLP